MVGDSGQCGHVYGGDIYAYNPSLWDPQTKGFQFQGQPEL